mmetsp:Transcript_31664/g.69240  ORF Transcript_31664/g.69240 Transcript_31664/m.69240 type:complete len:129 (-) Transcript_31664:248-634(-)
MPTPQPAGAVYLSHPRVYSCATCRTHLATHDQLISKAFQGRLGRAFLFSGAHNVLSSRAEDRTLMTGLHTVVDISCAGCEAQLGWKYVRAFETSQKYKEGKVVIEMGKLYLANTNMLAPCFGEPDFLS